MTKTTTLLAKAGLATKGILYILMGVLAAFTLFGRGRTEDSTGVFHFISEQLLGKVLLIAIVIGLIAYALYRFYQAIKGTKDYGNDFQGLVVRASFFLAGVLYALMAFTAFNVFLGTSSEQSEASQVARLLEWKYGREVLYGMAISIAGRAIYDAYVGWSKRHKAKIKEHELNNTGQKMLTQLARIGFTARALVFAVISFLLFKSAISLNPSEAGGTEEAFEWFQNELGTIMLAAIGLGLVAYGSFLLMRARYPDMSI